jgi:hypothetical protein
VTFVIIRGTGRFSQGESLAEFEESSRDVYRLMIEDGAARSLL